MALSAVMKGGLMKQGHNDHRDSDVWLAVMALGGVSVEPDLLQEKYNYQCRRIGWLEKSVWYRVAFFRYVYQ